MQLRAFFVVVVVILNKRVHGSRAQKHYSSSRCVITARKGDGRKWESKLSSQTGSHPGSLIVVLL